MFGLFGGSDSKIKIIDKVWMTKEAKWKACAQMLQVNPECIFITWFEETRHDLAQFLGNDACVQTADKIDVAGLKNKMVVFAGHYPLSQKEQALFKQLNLNEIPVISSLDEPLFMKFGGEKLIDLMKQLGMKDDEVLGHAMITTSIKRAQEKLERQVRMEKPANSAKEWFGFNLPA